MTRRLEDLPKVGDKQLEHQKQVVLKPHNLDLLANDTPPPEDPPDELSWDALFTKAFEDDPFPARILELLRTGAHHSKEILLAECSERERKLHYWD